MLEPAVTITDFVLATQSLCFAVLVYRESTDLPWLTFFGTLCIASLAGGVTHGFIPEESSLHYAILWKAALIAIAAMTAAGWHVGARFLVNHRVIRWIKKFAIVQFFLFSVVVLFYSQDFLLAAINYLPTALFLLAVFSRSYFRTKELAPLYGAIAIMLTFVGSFIQIVKISPHPQYFNHNALYHAVQFVAICLLFVTARWDIVREKYEK